MKPLFAFLSSMSHEQPMAQLDVNTNSTSRVEQKAAIFRAYTTKTILNHVYIKTT